MIVVGLADIHGRVDSIAAAADVLRGADLVVLAGDLTHFGGRDEAAQVVGAVRRHNGRILAVPGNCDADGVAAYLTEQEIDLHGRGRVVDGVGFVGAGGSLPVPGGGTPMELSEAELSDLLRRGAEELASVGAETVVAVVHQPPKDTATDRIGSGDHVGSVAVRDFLQDLPSSSVCFTGHIHESRGLERLGCCAVLNPGPLAQGHVARAHLMPPAPWVELVDLARQPDGGSRDG